MAKTNIKDSSNEIRESAQKIWLAGLGALAAAEDEGTKLFQRLVEKGEAFEAKGKRQMDEVKDKVEGAVGKAESSWEKLSSTVDDKVAEAINRLGVPSRSEINRLTKRVEELTVKVDQLKGQKKAAKST